MAVPKHSDAEWAETFRHHLSSDPTPGDPEQITTYANKFKDLADMCGNYRTKVVQAQQPNAEFQGKAAEAYRAHLNDLPELMLALQARFTVVWGALTTWARDLPDFQQRAENAFQAAKTAGQAMDAAQKKADAKGAKPDDVKAARTDHDHQKDAFQKALRDAQSAKDDHDKRAREAARSIHLAADDNLKNPHQSFWHKFADGLHAVCKVVSKWSSWIGTIAGALALICAIIPPLEVLAPIFAAVALIAGIASLLADIDLACYGEKDGWDIGLDVVGVLPFGRFAKFGKAAKAGLGELRGAKSLAQSADRVAGKFPEVANAMKGLSKDAPKYVGKDLLEHGKSFRFAYTPKEFANDFREARGITRSSLDALKNAPGLKTYGGLVAKGASGAIPDIVGYSAATGGQWGKAFIDNHGKPTAGPWTLPWTG
ncbi:MAG: hypothetical protein ACJ73S_23995 [Mycobacteriales bacterium]